MASPPSAPTTAASPASSPSFTVVKYLRYEKPEGAAPILDVILALKPGDLVDLQWNHDYVTREGSKFPERPIHKISPVSKEDARKTGEKPQ